jgi:hypothetical protein
MTEIQAVITLKDLVGAEVVVVFDPWHLHLQGWLEYHEGDVNDYTVESRDETGFIAFSHKDVKAIKFNKDTTFSIALYWSR